MLSLAGCYLNYWTGAMGGWAVWDVETLRLAYEVPNGWRNPAGFGISVAKALDEQGVMHTFYETDGAQLLAFLEAKDLAVGFNSISFDCGVLSAYGNVSAIRRRSLDLLRSLEQITGIPHPVSLGRLSQTTLGASKLLDDGGEAVTLWRGGDPEKRKLVEDYCEQDVRLTYALWVHGATHGKVRAAIAPRRGGPRQPRDIPVNWPAPDGVTARPVQGSLL